MYVDADAASASKLSAGELEAQINRIALKQLLNQKIAENMKNLLDARLNKKENEKREK